MADIAIPGSGVRAAPRAVPEHLYMLDVLRGLASLAVVLWHYRHFYFTQYDVIRGFNASSLPLYFLFWPFYEYGFHAVQLFFVLSGFVFYYIYSERIQNRVVSFYDFCVLRFSRLYPLHFVTLVFVATVQLGAYRTLGSFIIYRENDLRHFLLNLFFLSYWGLQRGYSFNGPTWSVSVEILLYLTFFASMLLSKRNLPIIAVSILIGLLMSYSLHSSFRDIGWGLYCFFSGGIAFLVSEQLKRQSALFSFSIVSVLFFCSAILSYIFTNFGLRFLSMVSLNGVCFPSLVLCLLLFQYYYHGAGRSFKLIGDITYSTYLLHFPIQLTIVWITTYCGIAVNYNSDITVLGFLGVVIGISIPTYYYFEAPAQLFLRQRLMQPRPVKVSKVLPMTGEGLR